jgi:hypothetical protein
MTKDDVVVVFGRPPDEWLEGEALPTACWWTNGGAALVMFRGSDDMIVKGSVFLGDGTRIGLLRSYTGL